MKQSCLISAQEYENKEIAIRARNNAHITHNS
jgi:hypothetical protein